MTLEARVASRDDFCEDLDFTNSFPNDTIAMPPDLKPDCQARYFRHPAARREAVSDYYRIPPDMAGEFSSCRFLGAQSQSAHVASRKMYSLWRPMYRTNRWNSVVVSPQTYIMWGTTSPPWGGEAQNSRLPHTPWRERRRESSTHVSKCAPVIFFKNETRPTPLVISGVFVGGLGIERSSDNYRSVSTSLIQ